MRGRVGGGGQVELDEQVDREAVIIMNALAGEPHGKVTHWKVRWKRKGRRGEKGRKMRERGRMRGRVGGGGHDGTRSGGAR